MNPEDRPHFTCPFCSLTNVSLRHIISACPENKLGKCICGLPLLECKTPKECAEKLGIRVLSANDVKDLI